MFKILTIDNDFWPLCISHAVSTSNQALDYSTYRSEPHLFRDKIRTKISHSKKYSIFLDIHFFAGIFTGNID